MELKKLFKTMFRSLLIIFYLYNYMISLHIYCLSILEETPPLSVFMRFILLFSPHIRGFVLGLSSYYWNSKSEDIGF